MEIPQRKPTRLTEYDYSAPGAYFVTICTHNRKRTLSRIVGAIHESPEVQLTEQGKIVDAVLTHLPSHLNVNIDKYVIMPNHVHLLLSVPCRSVERAIRESPLQGRSVLSIAIGFIKMNASKLIHAITDDAPVWQRSYYDHIIRGEQDYQDVWTYMDTNPVRWVEDEFYCTE